MLYVGITNFLFLLRYSLARSRILRQKYYFVVFSGLFLFSAFRYEVGCDWTGYYNEYLAATNIDWSFISSTREPVWWLILGFIQDMGLPYPVANIVSSAVFFVGVHVLARRQPDPFGFLVLLFPILIVNMPMSGIRQGAAIGLVCIAFTAFIDRRPIRFALWVILAAGFHASALVFLLLVPVAIGHYSKWRIIMAALLAVPGAILLAGGQSAEVASSRYIDTGVEAYGAIFRVGILGLSGIYFFLFVRTKWLRLFPNDYSIVNVGAVGMVLAIFLIPVSSVIVDRFGYYLIPIQAMIFARLPLLQFRSNQSLHCAIPYLGLLLVFLVWTQVSGHFQQCYIPYNSWIFGMPSSQY